MRWIVLTALMVIGADVALAQQSKLYHFRAGHGLACLSTDAVVTLSEPDAKERLGEINYMQFAVQGGCIEADNSRPIAICQAGPVVSFVQQVIPGSGPGGPYAVRCRFVLTAALMDDLGNSPVPGAE